MELKSHGVAILRDVEMGAHRRIHGADRRDARAGRFVVHGGEPELLEGDSPGDLIVIGFGDRARARARYDSPTYQEILPLRTENSKGTVFLVDGVDADHRATDVLAGLAPGLMPG